MYRSRRSSPPFELKAHDVRLFLPPGLYTRCDVLEESATHFVAEAMIAGPDPREIITRGPRLVAKTGLT